MWGPKFINTYSFVGHRVNSLYKFSGPHFIWWQEHLLSFYSKFIFLQKRVLMLDWQLRPWRSWTGVWTSWSPSRPTRVCQTWQQTNSKGCWTRNWVCSVRAANQETRLQIISPALTMVSTLIVDHRIFLDSIESVEEGNESD